MRRAALLIMVALFFISFFIGLLLTDKTIDVKGGFDRVEKGMTEDDVIRNMGVESGYYAINPIFTIPNGHFNCCTKEGIRIENVAHKGWVTEDGYVIISFEDHI